MGLSGSRIDEENHIVNGSWIAWLINGTILSVPFCSYYFVRYHLVLEPGYVLHTLKAGCYVIEVGKAFLYVENGNYGSGAET